MSKELEEQIGNLGGATGGGLGKLRSKSKKDQLTEEEQKSLEEFKERAKNIKEEQADVVVGSGWIPVDRSEMGTRSLFYPADWSFFVKPATVQLIKNWTSIDDNDPQQVYRILNEVVKSSVKIETGGSFGRGWQSINTWDRLWFVLKVREVTFAKGESKVEYEDECDKCGANIIYTLSPSALHYEFPDDDLIEKYWDGQKWVIDPEEYGVSHAQITLYTPTLGNDDTILEWVRAKVQMKQTVDETFITFLPWMFNKVPKDPQMIDKMFNKIYTEYKDWDINMFEFMSDVVRNINIDQSETLRVKCPECGQEGTSTVRFPNGVKELFRVETQVKKFGSR